MWLYLLSCQLNDTIITILRLLGMHTNDVAAISYGGEEVTLFFWNDEQLWQVLIDYDVAVPGADDGLSGLDGWRFGEEDSPSLPIDTDALERLHFSMEVLVLSLKKCASSAHVKRRMYRASFVWTFSIPLLALFLPFPICICCLPLLCYHFQLLLCSPIPYAKARAGTNRYMKGSCGLDCNTSHHDTLSCI